MSGNSTGLDVSALAQLIAAQLSAQVTATVRQTVIETLDEKLPERVNAILKRSGSIPTGRVSGSSTSGVGGLTVDTREPASPTPSTPLAVSTPFAKALAVFSGAAAPLNSTAAATTTSASASTSSAPERQSTPPVAQPQTQAPAQAQTAPSTPLAAAAGASASAITSPVPAAAAASPRGSTLGAMSPRTPTGGKAKLSTNMFKKGGNSGLAAAVKQMKAKEEAEKAAAAAAAAGGSAPAATTGADAATPTSAAASDDSAGAPTASGYAPPPGTFTMPPRVLSQSFSVTKSDAPAPAAAPAPASHDDTAATRGSGAAAAAASEGGSESAAKAKAGASMMGGGGGSRFAAAARKTQLVNRFASRSGTFSALTKDQIEMMKREIEEEDARQKAEKAAREAEQKEQIRLLIEEQKLIKEQAEAAVKAAPPTPTSAGKDSKSPAAPSPKAGGTDANYNSPKEVAVTGPAKAVDTRFSPHSFHFLEFLLPMLVLVQTISIPIRLALATEWMAALDDWAHALFLVGVALEYVQIKVDLNHPPFYVHARFSPSVYQKPVRVAIDIISLLPWAYLLPILNLLGIIGGAGADVAGSMAQFMSADSGAIAEGLAANAALGQSIPDLQCVAPLAWEIRYNALLRLPRLLPLGRFVRYLDTWETKNLIMAKVNPTVVRLLKLAFFMFLSAHLAGCGHFFVSHYEQCPAGNDWVIPDFIRVAPKGHQYIHAIYWGYAGMTGGGLETPITRMEHLFTLIVLLSGVTMYATLIGNLADIISQLNEQQEQFRRRMTDISNFMGDYNLPEEMQKRVRMCVQYTFGLDEQYVSGELEPHPRGREGFQVLDHLPRYLKDEVLCHVNRAIMQKVPLFQDCEEGLMRALLPLLVPDAVVPGDYLIREGDVGREMYLIQHGSLEVIADHRVVSKLGGGSYVGEMAILFEQKRMASVRAVTFCDVMILSKEAFDSVLAHFPDVEQSLRLQANKRRLTLHLQRQATMTSKAIADATKAAIATPTVAAIAEEPTAAAAAPAAAAAAPPTAAEAKKKKNK